MDILTVLGVVLGCMMLLGGSLWLMRGVIRRHRRRVIGNARSSGPPSAVDEPSKSMPSG